MNLTLKIWRQQNANDKGRLQEYKVADVSPDMSFLEMIDVLNDSLVRKGDDPVAFDHDCREGICGMCSLTINGVPHGPSETTTCQLYMRKFKDGETIYIEPFRVGAFPLLRDLAVNRSAFDRIQRAGGFVSAHVGSAPDGNAILVPKTQADRAMEAAACIGCGACAAACPNASAMLFVGAKVTHLASLPQGQPERDRRVLAMVRQMDAEGFGNCSNYLECEAVCPAEIPTSVIGQLNRDYSAALVKETL